MTEAIHESELNLLDYGKILWRRKIMLVILCTLSVGFTMVVSLMLPKYYRSEAMILALAPETGGLGAALSASPLPELLPDPWVGCLRPRTRSLFS